MLPSLASLLALLVLVLTCYGLGRPVVRRMRLEADDVLAGSVWSISLGLVIAGVVLMALGLAACLYRPLVGVLTFAAAFWSLTEVRSAVLACRVAGRGTVKEHFALPAPFSYGLMIFAFVAGASTLAGALAPPTDGDALCYHLELPKRFLDLHALSYLPHNDHATLPLLVEMWFLWAMVLDGPVAAQLVHWALGILMALATVLLVEKVINRSWALLAGAIVLLIPGVTNQMSAALNDVGLAAFTTLAVAAWLRGIEGDEDRRWFLLTGLFLGAAASIKYTALLMSAALALAWLWLLVRQAGRRTFHLRGAATAAVIAASIAGPWYVRAAWHRGNPVYPFFSQSLGARGPDVLPERKTPLGWNARDVASLPWQLTMRPERFGGRSHQLGPVFLLALPGLLLARRLRGLGLLLSIALLYTLLWYALRQNARFLYPIVPMLAAAVVWFWMELRRFPPLPRFAAASVFAGVMLLGAIVALERSWPRAAVALGIQSREDYLHQHEPMYALAARANELLLPGDRVLSQDYRTFYFDRPVTREAVFHRDTQYEDRLEHPSDLPRLLQENGFTHVLLAESAGPGIRYNSRLSQLVDEARAARPEAFLDIARHSFRDSDGAVRHYRLVALQ